MDWTVLEAKFPESPETQPDRRDVACQSVDWTGLDWTVHVDRTETSPAQHPQLHLPNTLPAAGVAGL